MAELGEALSERELDVLQRLAGGASNKEIADELTISPYTVKTHLRNIFTKLGVSTRTEATHVALQQGLLSIPGVLVVGGDAAADSNGSDNTAAATGPAAPASEPAPPIPARRPLSRGMRLGLALGALVLLTVGLLFILQRPPAFLVAGPGAMATPAELYPEEPIGDSRWLTSRPLAGPRAGRAVGVVGLDVYLISGETPDGLTPEVAIYDTRGRVWRVAAPKPTAVGEASAAELFGEIYVPGGRLANGEPTDIVEAYSPTQDAWRRVAALPWPLAGAAAVADGGFLYVFGGADEQGATDLAYVYDPGSDSWRPLEPLPAPRTLAAAAALTGKLHVIGGSDGLGSQRSCFVYDPVATAWDACPDLLEPRSAAGATVLLNKLYLIGGAADYGEVYDPNSRTWAVLNLPPGSEAWTQPGVVHVENRIFVQGGRRGEALSDGNFVYAPFVFQTYIPAASSDDEDAP